MINEIIDKVFDNADNAHRCHLATESFAEHAALGEFYEDVRAKLDTFVESAMGLDVPPPDAPTDIIIQLEEGLIRLTGQREDVCQEDATLLALYDELTAVYTRALFKLKRLK